MVIRYDDKGKFFTEVISKENVAVIVQTTTNRIEGYMHVRSGYRIKDELNSEDQFVAVTQAKIYGSDNNLLYTTEFLAVNIHEVIWVMPDSDLSTTPPAMENEE
jgi:hypothetical protein